MFCSARFSGCGLACPVCSLLVAGLLVAGLLVYSRLNALKAREQRREQLVFVTQSLQQLRVSAHWGATKSALSGWFIGILHVLLYTLARQQRVSAVRPTQNEDGCKVVIHLPTLLQSYLLGIVAWYAHRRSVEVSGSGRSPQVEDPWRGHGRPLCRRWELIALVHLGTNNARSKWHTHATFRQTESK